MPAKRLLIIGCGDVGTRVAALLRSRYRIYALTREASRFAELRGRGIIPLAGDLDRPESLEVLSGLAHDVIHLAPPPASGATDSRTAHLIAALARARSLPQHFVYISTSGVYGDCGGALVDESHPLNPQSARAARRADAEQRIRDWARRNRVHMSILRVPGIYAAERLPLERLRTGSPAIVAEQDSHTNHVHADDLANIVLAALHRGKPNRVYHASDDSDLKMGDYFDMVADTYRLPRPPRLPRDEVERAVSPMLWSFMNESRCLDNARMKQELKVELRYPTVAEALAVF